MRLGDGSAGGGAVCGLRHAPRGSARVRALGMACMALQKLDLAYDADLSELFALPDWWERRGARIVDRIT